MKLDHFRSQLLHRVAAKNSLDHIGPIFAACELLLHIFSSSLPVHVHHHLHVGVKGSPSAKLIF